MRRPSVKKDKSMPKKATKQNN